MDSGFQVLDSVFFVSETWTPDSSRSVGFRILELYSGFRNPAFRDSTSKKSPGLAYIRRCHDIQCNTVLATALAMENTENKHISVPFCWFSHDVTNGLKRCHVGLKSVLFRGILLSEQFMH